MLLGPNDELLLADFGIALGVQSSRSQSMEDMAGTVSYMAPELLQGRAVPASDQYALAVVIYEWLSGAPPFRGTFVEIASQHLLTPPPPLHQPAVSHEVEQVVLTALLKEPRQRFASIQEFAALQVIKNVPKITFSAMLVYGNSDRASYAQNLCFRGGLKFAAYDGAMAASATYLLPRSLVPHRVPPIGNLRCMLGDWLFFGGRELKGLAETALQEHRQGWPAIFPGR
jgi:serine/threonine protein kinase